MLLSRAVGHLVLGHSRYFSLQVIVRIGGLLCSEPLEERLLKLVASEECSQLVGGSLHCKVLNLSCRLATSATPLSMSALLHVIRPCHC